MSTESDPVVQNEVLYSSASATAPMGRFYVLEGIDGSGKSTVAKNLAEVLRSRLGRNVIHTAEPTRSWIGDAVRRANKEDSDPLIEAFLFLADRASHNIQIRKWLASGALVICDRYTASTVAYQGASLEGQVDDAVVWLRAVSSRVTITPDLTILLDIEPENSLARLAEREGRTKFESTDYLRRVREIYLQMANEEDGWEIIDASQSLGEVMEKAVTAIIRNL